jgi:hypothetical protein
MDRERVETLQHGLVAGLLGFVATALALGVLNLVGGRPFLFTPALLGGAYFYGLVDPAMVAYQPGPVLAFNGLHLVVMLIVGLISAYLAALSEKGPHFWYIAAIIWIFALFHMFGFVLSLTDPLRQAVSPWTLLIAGAVGAVAMAWYLLAVHPRLRAVFRDYSVGDAT